MGANICLMVEPLSTQSKSGLPPDLVSELSLAVVGELRERGWSIVLYADATISAAVGLSMLELRPDLPMERKEMPRGKLHIVPWLGDDEPEWQMLDSRDERGDRTEESESLKEILASMGLVNWPTDGIKELHKRCKAIIAIGRVFHSDFSSTPMPHRRFVIAEETPEGWRNVNEFMSEEQGALSPAELEKMSQDGPSHDPKKDEGHERRQGVAFRQAQWLVAVDNFVEHLTNPEIRGSDADTQ